MKRYDPNPDVNEVLVYSGAGAAAEQRQRDEVDALLWEAMSKSQRQMLRGTMEQQSAARKSNVRFHAAVVALVMICVTIFVILMVKI